MEKKETDTNHDLCVTKEMFPHLTDDEIISANKVFKEALDKEGTWLDKMKPPENVDEAVSLIYSLTYYYGGCFCVSKEVLMKKFSFLDEKSFVLLVKKLRYEGVNLKGIRLVGTMDKLGDIVDNIYVIDLI